VKFYTQKIATRTKPEKATVPFVTRTTCLSTVYALIYLSSPAVNLGFYCAVNTGKYRLEQEAQLSQRGRAMPRVVEYFG